MTAVVVLGRSTGVTVASFAVPVVGSSVTIGLPTKAPANVPCAETRGGFTPARFGGLFSVALKVMVVVLPAGKVKPKPVPLIGNVPGGGEGGSSAAALTAVPVTLAPFRLIAELFSAAATRSPARTAATFT